MEQLQVRVEEMETKITRCGEQAIFHMHQSEKGSAPARQREKMRAKTQMEERRRLQRQLDKAVVMSNAIQKQIDNILSSNMDMLIVDAMRGFNHVATNMVLPQRLTEVENLGEQLVDRQSEVTAMQEAIMGIGVNCMDGADTDADLWQELEDLMAPSVAVEADAAEVAAAADAEVAATAVAAAAVAAAAEAEVAAEAEAEVAAAAEVASAAEVAAASLRERAAADAAAAAETSTLMSADNTINNTAATAIMLSS
jgi:hypothetical protein